MEHEIEINSCLTIPEDADDAYCEQLYQNYLKDSDRGQTYTENEVCKELRIAFGGD